MKWKIIMRSMSIIIILITIFIIVLYEPNIKIEDMINLGEIKSEVEEDSTNESSISKDKEILKGTSYYTLTLDSIVNNLTLDERNIVKGILGKLSVIDCAKINSILNDDNIDSKKEALKYIKKRLLEEDYRMLENILNQYIDLV